MDGVLHTQRFDLVRRLGAGASGVVYEAENRTSGERVALKALARLDAASLYRFKREFRALAGVSHPNLVALHELFHERGHWYLVMELVHGRSFVDYVRDGRKVPDLCRLRLSLAQLVRALHALHQAGRLHRDIKPPNVLVTEQGRLVVLDFGFVRELDRDHFSESRDVLGTPAYMAPEQADGTGVTTASDWYAVGVMLFETLTGQLPFEGSGSELLLHKLQRDAARVSAVWPEVPSDLDQLCSALLARDPGARPSGRCLLERVGATSDLGPRLPDLAELFVGRAASLERLHEALAHARRRGEPRVVAITGASAIGKSALLEQLGHALAKSGAWVLSGRCHERENVPYKALDGIVDALARRLGELDQQALVQLLPRYLGALTLQFPVLLRIPEIAAQAARFTRPRDPSELRRHAASALHELLARIADRRPLVLLIDDLQWGDVDSVQLLRDGLRCEDTAALLIVTAHRPDERDSSPALRAFSDWQEELHGRGQMALLELEPLSNDDATELAHKLLGERASDRCLVQHLVREGRGVPLFVHELARHVLEGGSPNATLEQLVSHGLQRLSQQARRLVTYVAIASAPLSLAVARALASPELLEPPLRELLRAGLVRIASHPLESLDARHDRIRTIVRATLAPEQRTELHFALAQALLAEGADAELLAHHLLAAGEPARAARYLVSAGDAAGHALAFASAARCYELALAWGEFAHAEECALLMQLGAALANAGRAAEAGEVYVRASALASPEERPMVRARAVDQMLRGGQIERGVALGDELLRELGMAPAQTGSWALLGLLARRALLWLRGYDFEPRSEAEVDARALARVEAARAMCHALGHMDPFAAANMQARHLLLALGSGDAAAVARALGYEAVYLGIEGAAHSERALALLERQRTLLPVPTDAALEAVGHYARGVVDWGRGRWQAALETLDLAERGYRNHCVGAAWEILASQLLAFGCLSFLGRYGELRRRVVRTTDEASAHDDRLTLQWILAWQAIVDLLQGDGAAAQRAIVSARARLPKELYTLPHLFVLYAATFADLYAGRGAEAHDRLSQEWPAIQRSQLLRLQVYRIETLRLRAAAALCRTRSESALRRTLHAQVERELAALESEEVAWAQATALALRGELRAQQSAKQASLVCYQLADERFRALHMEAHAASCRRALGLLLGGHEGKLLVQLADEWFAREGVHAPARIPAVLIGAFTE